MPPHRLHGPVAAGRRGRSVSVAVLSPVTPGAAHYASIVRLGRLPLPIPDGTARSAAAGVNFTTGSLQERHPDGLYLGEERVPAGTSLSHLLLGPDEEIEIQWNLLREQKQVWCRPKRRQAIRV